MNYIKEMVKISGYLKTTKKKSKKDGWSEIFTTLSHFCQGKNQEKNFSFTNLNEYQQDK